MISNRRLGHRRQLASSQAGRCYFDGTFAYASWTQMFEVTRIRHACLI